MDVAYPFPLLAKVVGVSDSELKILEFEFLTFINYELFVSQDLYEKYEEVLQQWPEVQGDEDVQSQTTEAKSQQNLARDGEDGDMQKMEEAKETDDYAVIRKKVSGIQIVEGSVDSAPDFSTEDKPNPANPHEKPLSEWVTCGPARSGEENNLRQHRYSFENCDDEDEDTEMTIVDESDLGDDDFEEDVMLY